jgi:polysaccharide transporter, PST family
MSRPIKEAHRVVVSASTLAVFQVIGMLLPLLTLPVLARALGVELFGQIMLAQFVVLFGVVFIDSGFNVESQRRVAVAVDDQGRAQALADNLIARSLLACVVALAIVALGIFTPGLPMWMVGIALLHVAGTLLFPQWWFVAREEGLRMGLTSTAGRIISAGAVLLLVRSPSDAGIALLAASSATLLSGLMVLPGLWRTLRAHADAIDWRGYRGFMRSVQPMILSGFVASSAQSLPTVVLGWVSGSLQVGLFSAAERLTRAGAHVAGVMGLSVLNVAARMHRDGHHDMQQTGQWVLRWTAGVCLSASLLLALLAETVIRLLYGANFVDSVQVLQVLAMWLGLYVFRGIWLMLHWRVLGLLTQVSRIQWQEGISVALACLVGGWLQGAKGVAAGLVVSELGLLLRLYLFYRQTTRARP